MENEPLKIFTLDEVLDKHIGKKGTPERVAFEKSVRLGVLQFNLRKLKRKRRK